MWLGNSGRCGKAVFSSNQKRYRRHTQTSKKQNAITARAVTVSMPPWCCWNPKQGAKSPKQLREVITKRPLPNGIKKLVESLYIWYVICEQLELVEKKILKTNGGHKPLIRLSFLVVVVVRVHVILVLFSSFCIFYSNLFILTLLSSASQIYCFLLWYLVKKK